MEHILFWVIVGIVAGALARLVIPGEGPGGILGDLVTGILGALVGGWIFESVLDFRYSSWFSSTAVAFVGAVILLAILRGITHKRMVAR